MSTNIQQKDHIVSAFKDVFSKEKLNDISIYTFIDKIRDGDYRQLIEQIRNEPSKELRNKLKVKIPAISASCTVNGKRQLKDVLNHSGLMQIDVDDIDVTDSERVKNILAKDKYTFSTFYSPSGKVKCLVRVFPDINFHKNQFQALIDYYHYTYNIKCDESVKDVNRLMFYSWDPDIYCNPDSITFQESSNFIISRNDLDFNQTQGDALEVIRRIEEKGIDITGSHNDWIKIIFSLLEIFGDNSEEYVHRVSKFYPTYDYVETKEKIEACLKSKGDGITKDTFFYFAKIHGIEIGGLSSSPKEKEKAEVKNPPNEKDENRLNKFTLAKKYLFKKFEIRFNEVSLDFEYREKGSSKEFIVLNENNIFIELQENGLNISINNLVALLRSDFVEKFDPILHYFENLPQWDGIDHIESLAKYVKARDQKAFNHHFKKWLVRSVACAVIPVFFNKQIFTFISSTQNTGKSTFCRFLCPLQLSKYITENISTDKDSRIAITKNFLVNQDELSTMTRVDINALKSMLSQPTINERLPYDRKNSILPRRCSFMASTNSIEFLSDETGSVRWLCFEIESIDWNYSKDINIDKVYAQAYHLLKSGAFEYEMSPKEIEENNKRNRSFFIPTLEQVMIEKFFIQSKEKNDNCFFQSTQVVSRILELTDGKVRITPVGIGKALNYLGYEREKNSKFQVYGYYIQEKNI